MRDLGVLGGYSSYGTAINRANHVLGYSTVAANDGRVTAFFYDGTRLADLGSLGAGGDRWSSDLSVALAVNSSDQVVGYSYLPVVGDMPIRGENEFTGSDAVYERATQNTASVDLRDSGSLFWRGATFTKSFRGEG
jgi:probable HAF family extracellular repeat protein